MLIIVESIYTQLHEEVKISIPIASPRSVVRIHHTDSVTHGRSHDETRIAQQYRYIPNTTIVNACACTLMHLCVCTAT